MQNAAAVICLILITLGAECQGLCPDQCRCNNIILVDCSFANLHSFPHDVNPNVVQLNLSNNDFQSIEVNAELASITKLDLSSNNLEEVVFPKLDTLSTVILSNNSISNISLINLSKLEKITDLDVSYNSKLTELKGFSSKSLLNLDVSGCHLRDIDLKKLKNLHTLNISKNPIHKLNITSTSLLNLIIKHCHVTHLSTKKLSEELPNLKHLEISHNKNVILNLRHVHHALEHVDFQDIGLTEISIDGLKSLEYVNFAYNSIPRIYEKTFINNPRLSHLNISHLELFGISDHAFSEIQNLLVIDASHNNLTSFTVWRGELSSLRVLNISFNKLESLNCDTLPNLNDLNLSNNKIDKIPAEIQEILPAIQIINLRHNKIVHVLGVSSPTLKTLLLGSNQIVSLSSNSFSDLPVLSFLDLEGNHLTHFSPSTMSNLPRLSILQINENPWDCNCEDPEFKNFRDYLAHNKSLTPLSTLKCNNTKKSWDVVCLSPNDSRDVSITKPIVFVGVIFGILLFGVGVSVFLKMYSLNHVLPNSSHTRDSEITIQPEHPVYNTTVRRAQSADTLYPTRVQRQQSTTSSSPANVPPPTYEEALLLPPLTEFQRMTRSMDLLLERRSQDPVSLPRVPFDLPI